MISQDSIQQILSRIDIIEIVGSFVKLKKRGANYLGLCPFHGEKTPSFTVSPSKEIYKCFGCGKSGNAVGFLMDHEKYSYVEALKWLAQKYNVEIEEIGVSPEMKELRLTSDSLYIINQFAQKFFTDALFSSDEGQDIGLSYLKERGFREDIIRKFQLGFNPGARDSFAKAALEGQYNKELLLRTGLVVEREEKLQDNYRGRIIFPIHNQSGKIMGFGARIIKSNDRAPKYINTPENEIYVKSRILYGSYFARQAIDKMDECLLVEGYTDVISLHQAGIEHVVASGGTSLTIDQIRLIKKFSKNLTIIYDGDQAGIKAALRGLDLALEEGLHVRLVLLPDKEDPDSFVHKVGAGAFIEYIKENKKDFLIFQLEVSLKEAGSDAGAKSALVNQIAESIARINKAEDFTRRQDYIRQVSQILKVDEQGFNSLVNKIVRERINREEEKQSRQDETGSALQATAGAETEPDDSLSLLQSDEMQEKAMVRSLIEYGLYEWDKQITVADYMLAEIDQNELEQLIENNFLLQIIAEFRQKYQEGKEPDDRYFLYHEDQSLSHFVSQLMDVNTEISPNWGKFYQGKIPGREELYKEEVASSLNYLKLRKIKRLLEENQRDLEKASDPETQLIYMKTNIHLKEVEKELTRLSGTVIYK
jgi:DNA primase